MADRQTIDWILATIRQRESGGRYTAKNPHSTASGAYQYVNSTWRGWLQRYDPSLVSRYPTAMSAPPEVQDAVARLNVESILNAAGGRIDAVPRAWYTGNPNAPDSMQPAGPGNGGVTVGRYVSGWMNSYAQISGGQVPTPSSGGASAGVSGASGSMSAPSSADTRTPEEYAMEEYGYLAAFLQHPEVGPILLQAAAEQWSTDKLRGALHKTAWWKSTNEAARSWLALAGDGTNPGTDPAEAQSRVNARAAEIVQRANYLGYPITRARAEVIAKDSLMWGWEGAELDRAIGMDASGQQLVASTFGSRLQATARAYAVPVSEATLTSWAQRIAAGEDTEENFTSWARGQAANLFPTARAHLEAGGTVEEFFDPYRELAARTLQIAPEAIDLADPKWSAALSIPDADGNRRAMRIDEWQRTLMDDEKYGFQYTRNARNLAEDFVGRLKRMFGDAA